MHFPFMWKTGQEQQAPYYLRANPILAGMHTGLAGAASGLGVAAIQRAIRMQQGDMTPVHVVRPMLAGGLIGSVLGVLLANKINVKRDSEFKNERELADGLNVRLNGHPKYGPLPVLAKQAGIGDTLIHGLRVGGPWTFRLLAGLAAVPAIPQAVSSAKNMLDADDTKTKLRHGAGALGNLLFAASMISPAARGLKGLGAISGVARTGTAVKPDKVLSYWRDPKALFRAAKNAPEVTPYTESKAKLINYLGSKGIKLEAGTERGLSNVANTMERVGKPFNHPLAIAGAIGLPLLAPEYSDEPVKRTRIPWPQHAADVDISDYRFKRAQDYRSIHEIISDRAGGGAGGFAAGMSPYLIPGVGTAASLYDAGAQGLNMFGADKTIGQRLGHGAMALGNVGFAALNLVPGGGLLSSGLRGLGKGLFRLGAKGVGKSMIRSAPRIGRMGTIPMQRLQKLPGGQYITSNTGWQQGLRNKGLLGKFVASPMLHGTTALVAGGLMSGGLEGAEQGAEESAAKSLYPGLQRIANQPEQYNPIFDSLRGGINATVRR